MFGKEIESQIESLATKLKRRQIYGSQEVTIEAAKLYRNVIAGSRWNDLNSLLEIVNVVQTRLTTAQPIEFSSENTARRVLHIIHEEKLEMDRQQFQEQSSEQENSDGDESTPGFRELMKNYILQGIAEILDEIETASVHVASQALEHIHSNEIIMIIGYSKLLLHFLKEAARFRKFQLILAENAPFYDGHEMAAELSKAGIETTVVTDSAIYAVMSRVNKVILGAHAVTADGGLIAVSGSHIVASAAKHHATPVVVCACLHSMTGSYLINDCDAYNLCLSPEKVYRFDTLESCKNPEISNPYYDYVEPELLSLLITDFGPHPPSNLMQMFDHPTL